MTVKRQALKNVFQASWLFGHPVLRADNNSKAEWSAATTSPYNQKGGGWLAELYGGVQTNDDWAAIYIPVNEMPLTAFEKAQWSYYMTTSDSFGVNIVIWVHDPADFDNRAEITQMGSAALLDKAAGWGAHEFNTATTQMFYYGEGTTGTALTAGTQYTWEQFQADALFKDWLIYRISLEFGWQASGTFGTAYVAEVKLNEIPIPLFPRTPTHKKDVLTTKTIIGGAATALDVVSEHATTGTDWDFDFGGAGYITKAIVTIATTSLTERLALFLYSVPPTGEVNDNVASDAPLAADIPYFVGVIDFPALVDRAAGGPSYAVATPSTTGNLPIGFETNKIYGILVGLDGGTLGNVLCSIHLFADMEGN